jgi:hypothetical protein
MARISRAPVAYLPLLGVSPQKRGILLLLSQTRVQLLALLLLGLVSLSLSVLVSSLVILLESPVEELSSSGGDVCGTGGVKGSLDRSWR